MLRIGLTGGIASGKSTVSAYLRELGATVVDADRLAKEVVAPGTPGLAAVLRAFGPQYIDEAGKLRRRELGTLVFSNTVERDRLNAIVHPLVRARMAEEVARAQARGEATVVLDVPLLFESRLEAMVDEIWLVAVPPAVQVARLRARNGYDEGEARARLASQMPLEDKLERAHVVIWNDGTWEETRRRVHDLWQARAPRPEA
jgi:dephospho-CoA kinase